MHVDNNRHKLVCSLSVSCEESCKERTCSPQVSIPRLLIGGVVEGEVVCHETKEHTLGHLHTNLHTESTWREGDVAGLYGDLHKGLLNTKHVLRYI